MIPVCPRVDLTPGEVRLVRADVPIAVFCTEDDELFAIDDTCTHQATSLADGWVEGHVVECPLHESCFDLRTGEVTGPPAKVPVRTHGVDVVDGQVYVVPATEPPEVRRPAEPAGSVSTAPWSAPAASRVSTR